MKIAVVAVGRLKAGPERELAERYATRFAASGRSLGFTGPSVVEIAESQGRAAQERKAQEAAAMLQSISPDAPLIALDERGRAMTSADFAARLAGWRDAGRREVAFAIGGADGLGDAIRDRAELSVSFGAMTLPHQIVRILLLEQIYRAATILSGHPYHRA